jgi:hypothetical protein
MSCPHGNTRLVSERFVSVGLGPHPFGTVSLRRTKAADAMPPDTWKGDEQITWDFVDDHELRAGLLERGFPSSPRFFRAREDNLFRSK